MVAANTQTRKSPAAIQTTRPCRSGATPSRRAPIAAATPIASTARSERRVWTCVEPKVEPTAGWKLACRKSTGSATTNNATAGVSSRRCSGRARAAVVASISAPIGTEPEGTTEFSAFCCVRHAFHELARAVGVVVRRQQPGVDARARSLGQALDERPVREHADEGARERARVAGLDEHAVDAVLEQVGDPADAGADHGTTTTQRLDDHAAEAFR